MKKKHDKLFKYSTRIIALILAIVFVAIFAGPSILRLYVEMGMGGSASQPIFATIPQETVDNPPVDTAYLEELTPYRYADLEILLPKKFTVVKEIKTKVYYKRRKAIDRNAMIYILRKKPGFFIDLFPRIKGPQMNSNYEFISKVMSAKTHEINNITGAFFSIIKSIFTPNMGNQENLKIVKFSTPEKRGFVCYNLTPEANYFDCNFVDNQDNYFKIYIKDKPISLDLNKVLSIISTAESKAK